jgi:hypothetical protein
MKPFVLKFVPLPMKTLRITLTALTGLFAAAGIQAASNHDREKNASRVEVVFSDPDKFTDAADGARGSEFGRDANLAAIKDHLIERAASRLPEGQHLSVTITDIDLAGEVEPWRTRDNSDVRIVKEIYAPRIDLTYRLTDASGAVIKEGKSQLRDMNFMNRINPMRSDPRVYENELIDTWIRNELSQPKKK